MNRNLPSPEDADLDVRSSKLERQLRRLQPRPTCFDPDAIMKSAGAVDKQAALASSSQQSTDESTPIQPLQPLAPIVVSSLCGAIAGALAMCVILAPGRSEQSAAHSDEESPQPTASFVKSGVGVETTLADGSEIAEPRWSRSEWRIAAQLSSLHRPRSTSEPTLTARMPHDWAPSVSHPDDAANAEAPGTPLELTEGVPDSAASRSIDRSQLLRQLLGDSPKVRL